MNELKLAYNTQTKKNHLVGVTGSVIEYDYGSLDPGLRIDKTRNLGQLAISNNAPSLGGLVSVSTPESLDSDLSGAQPGDIITLAEGTYDLGTDTITIPTGVTLSGVGKGKTIIISTPPASTPIVTMGHNSILKDLTVQARANGGIDFPVGIVNYSGDAFTCLVRDVSIIGFTDGLYFSAATSETKMELIFENVIVDTTFDACVLLGSSIRVIIRNCNFSAVATANTASAIIASVKSMLIDGGSFRAEAAQAVAATALILTIGRVVARSVELESIAAAGTPLDVTIATGASFQIEGNSIFDSAKITIAGKLGGYVRHRIEPPGSFVNDADIYSNGIVGHSVAMTIQATFGSTASYEALVNKLPGSSNEFANLADSNTLTGYTNTSQCFPDSETVNDAVYIGAPHKFCYVRNLAVAAGVYSGNSTIWEYWNGSSWATITMAANSGNGRDSTDTTAQNGLRSLQQTAAFSFLPPTNWAQVAVNGITKYWIRCRVTAATITTIPRSTFSLRLPEAGFAVPDSGAIAGCIFTDRSTGTTHANIVKFFIANFTKGTFSKEMSITASQKIQTFDATACGIFAFDAGDIIYPICTQKDATNEIINASLALITTN